MGGNWGNYIQIAIFVLIFGASALGWVIPRYPPDHPKMQTYIARATRSVEALQKGRNFFLEGF